jgi:hypothetical protein
MVKIRVNKEGVIEYEFNSPEEFAKYRREIVKFYCDLFFKEPVVEAVLIDTSKLPSPRDIASYIEKKPKFAHSMKELEEHFLGRKIDSLREKKLYNIFRGRVRRAHWIVERKNHGRFKSIRRTVVINGKPKAYVEYVFNSFAKSLD